MQAELAFRCNTKLGEGAFWHPERQRLFWLDVPLPSKLFIYDPVSGALDIHNMPQMITAMRPWGGGLIVAAHAGIYSYDLGSRAFEMVLAPEPDLPFNRCNDGGTDARGRFWFGTMQNNLSPSATDIALVQQSGTLYRLDPDFTLTAFDTGIAISNTLCFSPDNAALYFCDTAEGVIRRYAYNLASGRPGRRTDLPRFDRGVPDGSCIDSDGGLWNARWDGHCVVRFAPDGNIDTVVELPASQPTSVAFGGPDLGDLYITTARWTENPTPADGQLYVARPGRRGLPVTSFGGDWSALNR